MKKNRSKILFMLLLSSLISKSSLAEEPFEVQESFQKVTNQKLTNSNVNQKRKTDYKLIEKILKEKNKELKNLYEQSDYIVIPEYLEWQVFSTAFYEKLHRRGTSTHKELNSVNPSKRPIIVPDPGVKRDVVIKIVKVAKEASAKNQSFIEIPHNTPTQGTVTTPELPGVSEINVGNFTPPTVLNLPSPDAPQILDVIVSATAPNVLINTPEVKNFNVSIPQIPVIEAPIINDIMAIKEPVLPLVPTVTASAFNPVSLNIVPPVIPAPPVFNIRLGSYCNDMVGCGNGTDGGGLSGNPLSYYTNGGNFNINIGSTRAGLANGTPAIRYSWLTSNAFNGTLLKVYFDFTGGSNSGGSGTLLADLTVDSINTLTSAQKTTETIAGRTWNTQSFLVGGSRIATLDNVSNTTLINNSTINLVGPLVAGFEIQTDTNLGGNQGKREIINKKLITDAAEANSTALNTALAKGATVNLTLPAYAGGGTIAVKRDADGFTGYKVGLIVTYENSDTNSNNSYVLTNDTSGTIDFKGAKSIGVQIYAPNSAGTPIKVTNAGIINMGGTESYGLKLSSRANQTGMVFTNTGTINITGGDSVNNSVSSGMAVIEDTALTGTNSIRAYTGVVSNKGIINVSGGLGNSGMTLKLRPSDNITNTGTINVSGNSNVGMRVDYGSVSAGTGTDGSPSSINTNVITVAGTRNLGILANGYKDTSNRSTGVNSGDINLSATGSAALFSIAGGTVSNTATGARKISVTGTNSIGLVVVDSTSSGVNSGIISVTGANSGGIYNAGTLTSTGTVSSSGLGGVGVYSKSGATTNIQSGSITVSGGSTALYSDNTTINLASPVINVNSGGLMFYGNGTGALAGGTATANINNGGTAFYISGGSGPILSSLISSGNLTLNMSAGSNLVVWNQPTGVLNLSSIYSGGVPSISHTTVNDLSGGLYRIFLINKANVLIDQNLTLIGSGAQKFDFVSSSVQLGSGFSITGTGAGQIGIVQRNYTGGTLANINLLNNGTINLGGNDSTGIAGDFANINNSNTINISGNNSTGIFGANGSAVQNNGTINLGILGTNNSGVGIYGTNKFDANTVTYGDGTINIINKGTIKYTGSTASTGVGIYVNNDNLITNSVISLQTGSNIDMSASENGSGIYSDKTVINITDGVINAGATTGIYATGGSIINSSSGNIKIGNGGVGVNLSANSKYNETSGKTGKFTILEDGAAIFNLDSTAYFEITPSNIDNTTNMGVGNPLKFILGTVGTQSYIQNTGINFGNIQNGTFFGVNMGVFSLSSTGILQSSGKNTIGIGAKGIKDALVSYISDPYEIVNEGNIVLTGANSTGIYTKDGAKALNKNMINIDQVSSGMYTGGSDSIVENAGSIVVGQGSAGMYSEAVKVLLGEAGAINNGAITSVQVSPGVYVPNTTGIYVNSGGEGHNNLGTIDFSGNNSVGIFNEGKFQMAGGDITLNSAGGVAVYSSGTTSETKIVGGMIKSANGSVALYADNSVINLSGGSFQIGNNGLLFYNYPTSIGSPFGQLVITNSPTVVIQNGGMGFYVGEENLSDISLFLNNIISSSSTGVMQIKMEDGSSLIRWNNPGEPLNLSGIPSLGTVNGIDYTTLTIPGTNYREYSINRGELIIDKDITLQFMGNSYSGVEMSESKVTLAEGYTITDSLDGQVAIAQSNYFKTTPLPTDVNDIAIMNNGNIILNKNSAVGMASNYGLINNNLNGLVNLNGSDSVGIVGANGSIVTNDGTINVAGARSVGIYSRNYFDGLTNSAALGYGNDTINVFNNGKIELSSSDLNSEVYGIYLENNGSVLNNQSVLTLGSGSQILVGDNNILSPNRSIGVTLINSTLNSDGEIKIGKNGLGIYADNSILTGIGAVKEIGDQSVGYFLEGAVNSNLQLGSVEINGDGLALYKIGDYVSGTDVFNTGNIDITSTDGGTLIVGSIGKNRSIVLDNEININTPVNNTLEGTVISSENASLLFDSNFRITSETNGIIGIGSKGNYTGTNWADSLNSGYEIVHKGKIDLKDGSVGIYAGIGSGVLNTAMGEIKIGSNSVGIYSNDLAVASLGLNQGTIQINGNESTALRIDGVSKINNQGTIESLTGNLGNYNNMRGIIVTNGATGTNSGTITLNGDNSIGMYTENGNLKMSGGSIFVNGSQSVGIYSKGNTANTEITGGTIEVKGGLGSSVAMYADESVINISNGVSIKSSNNGILFNTSFSGLTPTGSFNLVSGTVNAEIGENGIGFYHKGDTSDAGVTAFINSIFTGSGNLLVNVTDSSGKLFVIESTGGITNLSSVSIGNIGILTGTNISVTPGSVLGYNVFVVDKGELIINQNVNLDNINDAYNNIDFTSSKVTVNSGITMTAIDDNKIAVAQKNFNGGLVTDVILNNLGGTIGLSGGNSIALLGDFAQIKNSGEINIGGENSTAILAANGSEALNTGTINISGKGVGIYGVNILGDTVPDYGNQTIRIENDGTIKSTFTGGASYGIVANNIDPDKVKSDSVILLSNNSVIDMSDSIGGIGIYANATELEINGSIKAGKNGTAVYGTDTDVEITALNLDLSGNNSVGFNLAGDSGINAVGDINVNISGNDSIIFYIDSTADITGLGENLKITSAPGVAFTLGAINNSKFDFTNTFNNIIEMGNSQVTSLTGINSAVRYGGNVTVNGTGDFQTGIAVYGQADPTEFITGYTNYEVINESEINLKNKSTGIYGEDGARVYNNGEITMADYSLGISVKDIDSKIENHGTINLGNYSNALNIKDGVSVYNYGDIISTGIDAVGIYVENLTGVAENNGNINLSGDQSVGIYSTGINSQTINNNGTITIGSSLDVLNSGAGIYYNNSVPGIINSNNILVGDKSIGIYNGGSAVNQNGMLSTGNDSIGVYFTGGSVLFDTGSTLNLGENSVGVYSTSNGNINMNSNNDILIGDNSFGIVQTNGGIISNISTTGKVELGTKSTYIFATGNSNIVNDSNIIMNGNESTGFYINGGYLKNTGNITDLNTLAPTGIYMNNGTVMNTGTMNLGDSIVITKPDGTVDTTQSNYTVGIYGFNSNITNDTTGNIKVGKNGAAIYSESTIKDLSNQPLVINNGIISSTSEGVFGIYGINSNITNNGTIELTGENSTGIAAQNSTVTNNGLIVMRGNNSVGINVLSGSVINNSGRIEIYGSNSVGLLKTLDTLIINSGTIYIDSSATSSKDIDQTSSSVASQTMSKPVIKTSGSIIVNDDFKLEGISLIIEPNPSKMTLKQESLGDKNNDTIIYSSEIPFFKADTLTIAETIIIAPTFIKGAVSNKYKLENLIVSNNGQITTPSGEPLFKSGSLTWDITPVKNALGGYDIYAERKNYNDFTNGLWFEDFGRVLEDNYLNSGSNSEKAEIYDKINNISNEQDFRKNLSSLAGEIYANINRREATIAGIFDDSLDLLQNSKNNTKENVKINVIAGKGKVKENADGVVNYNFESVGVLALREVERTYKNTFGYSLGYLHTSFEFDDNNDSEEWVDTIQLGLHNKYKSNDWIMRNDLTARVSNHNVDRNIDWENSGRSEMNGEFQTYSISLDNTLGREVYLNANNNIVPYAGLETMYVIRPTFTEDGLERLEVKGNSAWSVKPKVGIKMNTSIPLGERKEWKLKGVLDVAYEYELANLNEREKAKLVAVENDYHNLAKPGKENGSVKTTAEIGVEIEDRYGLFLTGTYTAGSHNQEDYRAGVSLKAVF